MRKSDIKVVPEYFMTYINKVEDKPLMELLPEGGIDLFLDHLDQIEELGLRVYEEGKWTVNEMVEHLMDTELLFLNRSIRFARNDKTELPGYDENQYASNARSNDIPIRDLIHQYKDLRKVSCNIFGNFNEEELMRTGFANGLEISVLAMGFVHIGHPIHHFGVLKERYFPLISPQQ